MTQGENFVKHKFLAFLLAVATLSVSGTGCGAKYNSDGTNAQDQLARIKKMDAQGKPLGAKQKELLEESRQIEVSEKDKNTSAP